MTLLESAAQSPSSAVILGLVPRIYGGRRLTLAPPYRGRQILGTSPRMTVDAVGGSIL